MSTRATIKFTDDYGEEYYVYRHSDGYPENILRDVARASEKAKGRWSGAEVGRFVTFFLTFFYDFEKMRLPDYQITGSFHGDESYRYYAAFSEEKGEWEIAKID